MGPLNTSIWLADERFDVSIIFRETQSERSSRQLSWPYYRSVSLRQMISVISKVLQQKNNQNP